MNLSNVTNPSMGGASMANVSMSNASMDVVLHPLLPVAPNKTGYEAVLNDTCVAGLLPSLDTDPWLNFAPCAIQVAMLLSWAFMLARPQHHWLAVAASAITVSLQAEALTGTLGSLSVTGSATLTGWLVAPLVALGGTLGDRFRIGNFTRLIRLACFAHAVCWALVFPPMLIGLWGLEPSVQGALYIPVPRAMYDFSPGDRAPVGFAIAETCRCLAATLSMQLYGRTVAHDRHPCLWLVLPFILFACATALALASSTCPTTATSTCYPAVPWPFLCHGSYPLKCEIDSVGFFNLVALVTLIASAEPFAEWVAHSWMPLRAALAASYTVALVLLPHLLISRTLVGPIKAVPDVTAAISSPCLPFRSVATLGYLGLAQAMTSGLSVDLFVPQIAVRTGTITWDGFSMRP